MTEKAYIVANKEQELDVLKKFEQQGLLWGSGENPAEWIPSESSLFILSLGFPYALIERENVSWSSVTESTDKTIVYDGRKEEKMDRKYKVTQEFMKELIEWRDVKEINASFDNSIAYIVGSDLYDVPALVRDWWIKSPFASVENNERLIAIIKWLNGEDVFEVEKPHKFVVRSDKKNQNGYYAYVVVEEDMAAISYRFKNTTKFDTREEAQEWANSHQVVVEIDEKGNEVE